MQSETQFISFQANKNTKKEKLKKQNLQKLTEILHYIVFFTRETKIFSDKFRCVLNLIFSYKFYLFILWFLSDACLGLSVYFPSNCFFPQNLPWSLEVHFPQHIYLDLYIDFFTKFILGSLPASFLHYSEANHCWIWSVLKKSTTGIWLSKLSVFFF